MEPNDIDTASESANRSNGTTTGTEENGVAGRSSADHGVGRRGFLRAGALAVTGLAGIASVGSAAGAAYTELEIRGPGDGTVATYEFSVNRTLLPDWDTLQSNDGTDATGFGASGKVSGGSDRYEFSGEMDSFAYTGELTVFLDGDEVDPDSLAGEDSTESADNEDERNEDEVYLVTVEANGTYSPYWIEAGEEEYLEEYDRINGTDGVNDKRTRATGRVRGNGSDRYLLIGGRSYGSSVDNRATVTAERMN